MLRDMISVSYVSATYTASNELTGNIPSELTSITTLTKLLLLLNLTLLGWTMNPMIRDYRANDNRIVNSILKCLDYFNNNEHILKCSLSLLLLLEANNS